MSTPDVPADVPKYLTDGVQKQEVGTLRELRGYIDDLIAHKQRPPAVPDDGDVVSEQHEVDGKTGTVVEEMVKCGKDGCKCSEGDLHGPYNYLYYRDAKGTMTSEYLGKA